MRFACVPVGTGGDGISVGESATGARNDLAPRCVFVAMVEVGVDECVRRGLGALAAIVCATLVLPVRLTLAACRRETGCDGLGVAFSGDPYVSAARVGAIAFAIGRMLHVTAREF